MAKKENIGGADSAVVSTELVVIDGVEMILVANGDGSTFTFAI